MIIIWMQGGQTWTSSPSPKEQKLRGFTQMEEFAQREKISTTSPT